MAGCPLAWVTRTSVLSSPDYRPHGMGALKKPSRGSWGVVPSRNIIIPRPVYLAPPSSTYGVPTVCLPHNGIHTFSSWRLGVGGNWALTPSGNFRFRCFSPFRGSPCTEDVLTVSRKALQFPFSLLSLKTATHPLSALQSSSPPQDLCTRCLLHLEDFPSTARFLHEIGNFSLWP